MERGVAVTKMLRLLVDEDGLQAKSALPIPGLDAVGQRVVELGSDVLRSSIDSALQGILEILSSVNAESATHTVSEVSFNLAFDASGEVSVVSVVKGNLKGSTGLQFTIKKK